MAKPHVHVVVACEHIPTPLQTALDEVRATASFWPLQVALREGIPTAGDVVVIVTPADSADLSARLEVLLDRLADRPRPTLVLSAGGPLQRRPAHPSILPVCHVSEPTVANLVARLETLLDLRHTFSALTAVGNTVRSQAERIQARYKDQLRVASMVQRELTQHPLPRLGPVAFHALYRPQELVSGDVFEVAQLEPHRVGFFLADACGHGLPAAMLTMFMKRALRGSTRRTGSDGAASPVEVLARLNEDLCDSSLTDCPFVAAICGTLDVQTLELRFARAGTPYPIVRTAEGQATLWRSEGSVLGVMPRAEFPLESLQLARGDSFVAYSDGLDRIERPAITAERLAHTFGRAATFAAEGTAEGAGTTAVGVLTHEDARTDDATAPDLTITRSAWYRSLREHGPQAAIEEARVRFESLRRMGDPLDDLTILAIEVDP